MRAKPIFQWRPVDDWKLNVGLGTIHIALKIFPNGIENCAARLHIPVITQWASHVLQDVPERGGASACLRREKHVSSENETNSSEALVALHRALLA